MTTLTKTEAEAILERLADKTLTRGCLVKHRDGSVHEIAGERSGGELSIFTENGLETYTPFSKYGCEKYYSVLGHPILIGDVLERLKAMDMEPSYDLLHVWDKLGFTLSLQEIFNRLEWEEECSVCGMVQDFEGGDYCRCEEENPKRIIQVAKPSPFADLFIFLKEIGL